MRVFLNPGHSSEYEVTNGIDDDQGASANGLYENQVAAEVGNRLESYFRAWGVEVCGNLQSCDLHDVVRQSNESGADVFVSIHCNSASSPAATGIETFFCKGSSRGREVADYVQKRLIDEIGLADRGVKDDTRTAVGSLFVLRQTDAPAILVELAFISNPEDAALLRERPEDFARAIGYGIMDWAGLAIPKDTAQETAWQQDLKDIQQEINVSNLDTGEIEKIARLARKYESNGDPAAISSGAGDLGGVSYGMYQLSSKVGAVAEFIAWLCEYPKPEYANYGLVLAGNPINSSQFKADWKSIGTIDPGGFGMLQDEYIKEMYYEKASKLLCHEDYCADKHSAAMKAVILSRAVQNGPTGAKNLFDEVCQRLGYPNLSYVDDKYFDREMIGAIYDYLIAECDAAHEDGQGIMRSPFGFCNGSRGVISGLRNRFVREKQDALAMLNE